MSGIHRERNELPYVIGDQTCSMTRYLDNKGRDAGRGPKSGLGN